MKQGCSLSCYLYILCIQPLLDALEADPQYQGIPVPQAPEESPTGDDGAAEARTTAYADDLGLYLRGYDGLRVAGPHIRDYNCASGARSN